AQWEQVIAEAKKEAKVTAVTPSGEARRQLFTDFQTKYGIPVELLQGNGNADLVPRIATERKAGQYLWDVVVHSPNSVYDGFEPLGAIDTLRPALLLPEVLDSDQWQGGFDAGWADKDKAYSYGFAAKALQLVYVNRDAAPESKLRSLDQLWEPQWKGKTAWQDPRAPSSGAFAAATLLKVDGEGKLRSFFRDQRPVLTRDFRQLAEWVVRGEYPVVFGLDVAVLNDLGSSGLNIKPIQPLDPANPATVTLSFGGSAVALFARAPHPNAAQLFINFVLSREGQTTYSRVTGYNSRRTDVSIVDPTSVVNPKRQYINLSLEENNPLTRQAVDIASELLK
ncbi:MAG TPA: extracellular solute-binding protein, partial [Chloroflexota bacterium]|nr:extracellular solute-binding protein [Chloroflexota bacterium]